MQRRLGLATLLVGLTLSATAAAQGSAAGASHPFSVHDMLALRRVADPQLSPDGRQVAFSLRDTDLEGNRGRFDLWSVGSDGKGLRQLTTHPAADLAPRWTAAGKLAFLSTRSGSSQVWELDPSGGEARQVTELAVSVDDFLTLPDGRLLLVIETYPECSDLACTVEKDAAQAARKASGRIYEQLFVRHWDTWKDGKRRHLFVWRPGDAAAPRDLMPGLDADSPSKPWGGVEELAVTPDGRSLIYTARVAGREEAWSTDFNLYQVALAGGEARCLTCENRAWDTSPVISADGRSLAWLAMRRPGFEADRFQIRILDLASGKARDLAPDWDRSPHSLAFSPDGKRLFAVADSLGQTSLFAIEVASGKVKTLVEQGNVQPPVVGAKRLVFTKDDLQGPREIYSLGLDGKDLKALTAINAPLIAATRRGEAQQFQFQGAHGDTVYGYLVKPVDFDPAKRYPVAFLIHGGPQGSFGNNFHYRWNPQAYAGAGYAAIMIDFHGSTGYGQAFQDAIRGDWGGAPYEDLMKGLDHALATFPFLDDARVCALGASYGGYMINWIAGQTDRFACLVNHDGNLDERFAYYDTEELWFPEWEHGGTPWENPAGYAKHNPVDHVAKWKTPMLVVHGGQDFRVVETQGLGTFNVLQRRGIPSKLLYFPDENHWVLKPHNSILWHETVLGWLDQWTRPGASAR